ncbi:DoxX family protein [Flavobacterium sp. GA093]|uniref:DoxX family protein n=1 Tax=Flavobacterium hydrocarbonoxydans TaxID=2683249 RepID=A0A6I4NM20_9FLAO|nr:DoxX family protein [Flavobacterium hydrocarbonoxydans]MWB95390.1 DoxX family protein [Flavobacterium hydrocarbonoxydans]
MTREQKTSKTMTIILWIAQVLLAATFISGGIMKLFYPHELPFPWVKENEILVKLTGILDLLAGIGLVLPTLINIYPKLTIYAAYGTIILMTAASIFHISRGEAKDIGFNVFVAITAVFIVWGLRRKIAFTPEKL